MVFYLSRNNGCALSYRKHTWIERKRDSLIHLALSCMKVWAMLIVCRATGSLKDIRNLKDMLAIGLCKTNEKQEFTLKCIYNDNSSEIIIIIHIIQNLFTKNILILKKRVSYIQHQYVTAAQGACNFPIISFLSKKTSIIMLFIAYFLKNNNEI